jgi:hypothetical protein
MIFVIMFFYLVIGFSYGEFEYPDNGDKILAIALIWPILLAILFIKTFLIMFVGLSKSLIRFPITAFKILKDVIND